ncbi:MAG: glycoside hydrolase family 3 C-terminal domain-containing protein [Oscillospiraceae bacterium]|nr:glycoside hydrolase family 3 C-terminal domain-containing protein [Oscillospiraceae bacterium]
MHIKRWDGKPERWARYKYNLTTNIGENGKRLTGCEEHIALSKAVAEEGMVLLENNGLLPLKEGTKVALFGVGSLDFVKGGGGSGRVFPAYTRNVYEGFAAKAPRFSIYEPLSQYYYDYAMTQCEADPRIHNYFALVQETEVPETLVCDAAKNADVAVIVIHRYSGESSDRKAEKGDFYLTDVEQKLVDDVTAAFAHSVVVLNVGAIVDTEWIRNNPKIDAALLAWQPGMEGGLVVADILCGDVNPSGKLVDTFAKSFSDYPSADTFHDSDDYVAYYEDIYVGYRYFETIPGAKERVNYPFGYGLSYTRFDKTKPVAALKDDKIEVSISVSNVGEMAGKEVIQIYFSAPQGRLGKSAISLIGFQKTKLLAPGEKEDISITFPVSDMASFDDLGKCQMSAYVLEQGNYQFFAGTSCRELQKCDYEYTVTEEYVVTKQLKQLCAPNMLEKRMLSDGSFEELPTFPVVHYPAQPIESSAVKAPEKLQSLSAVAEGKLSLDEFVGQMTDEELIQMVSGIPDRGLANTNGWGGIDRLGIPAVMTADGPAGLRINPAVGIPTTAWPCATLVASTWNPELSYEMGVAGGMECKENGIATWLTPAMNLHRNPLCGRNFEYYSEDPLIAGKFAAAKVRGIQSTHTAASVKHFVANNKETNRYYSDSRMSERALREIYLRGFEICVKESQPWTIMTSYNVLNGRRVCECFELLDGILRGEWGYNNMVITDWHGPCNQEHNIIAGNDVRMPTGYPDVLREALKHRRIRREHLGICVKRILEMILKLD